MYLAICDDNIADRKQTERLLGRQSDRIFKECGERIYIDSFGNVEAFMQNPKMYNGLFVDMVSSEVTGADIAGMLLEGGVDSPIIMCCSGVNYREVLQSAGIKADNIFFIDKPIKVAELTEIIDLIRSKNVDTEPTLELRGSETTIYAHERDIIGAAKVKSHLEVYLTEGRSITIISDIYNFYDQCIVFPNIIAVSDMGIVNIEHVTGTTFNKVQLDNGMTLPLSFGYRKPLVEVLKKRKQS